MEWQAWKRDQTAQANQKDCIALQNSLLDEWANEIQSKHKTMHTGIRLFTYTLISLEIWFIIRKDLGVMMASSMKGQLNIRQK